MRFSTCLVQFLSLLLPITFAVSAPTSGTCNGHTELCDRPYGSLTFVGAHNSYAVGTNNLATNQEVDITQQLNDGVRLLQMQVHNQEGVIQLCHTSCVLYNGGTLVDYLKTVKTWMDANPTDVLTLLIVNSDGFKPTEYAAVFASAGLDVMSYTPPTATLGVQDWPTLGSLITAGTRLITFLDNGADFNSVPWLLNEFTNVWETAFNVVDTFDCNVNRTKGTPETQLYAINHFKDKLVAGFPAPDKDAAAITNGVSGASSLGQHVSDCAAIYNRNPNFLLVDFYQYGGGSVFQVAANANGVSYAPVTPIAQPVSVTPSNSSAKSSMTGTSGATSIVPRLSSTASFFTLVVLGFSMI